MHNAGITCKPAGAFDIHFPITKVDKEKRLVSGFATLDNVDKERDRITAEASERAFSQWRGNIREMHQPKAVGKAVNMEMRKYFAADGEEYNGMYVSAYVSKGAQDTWEKVLDGTLTGFSIGGVATKHEMEKSGDITVRKITDYMLTELSLVDNPGNQYANLLSIEKNTVTGASVVDLLDVYYNDANEEFLLAKTDGVFDEPGYEYKGWIEDGAGRLENLKKLLGGNMSEETVNEVSEVSETVEEQPSLEELFEKFATEVTTAISKVQGTVADTSETTGSVVEKLESLEGSMQETLAKSEELASTVAELQDRLSKVENTGGEQKSGELESDESDEDEDEVESKIVSKVFGGAFLPRAELLR